MRGHAGRKEYNKAYATKIEDDIEPTKEGKESPENNSSEENSQADPSSSEDNQSDNKQDFGRY